MTTPSRRFKVGKLESRFPSPVDFYETQLEFSFHHPYERKVIKMVMYYKDMSDVRVMRTTRTLRFKINRNLAQFGNDYDPKDARDFIAIALNSDVDVAALKNSVLPIIRSS